MTRRLKARIVEQEEEAVARLYTKDLAETQPILSTVSSRYLATTTEQIKDIACAVVAVRLCKLVRLLYLFGVKKYKSSIIPIINPNPSYSN
jgi:hypothetical protein